MGGVLTHTIAAIACLLVVHSLHFKWEYSIAIFIGNFLPDSIKFGLTAIKQGTLAVFYVEQDSFYWFWANLTNDPATWFSIGFFLFGMLLLLFHFHYIKKKKMEEYDELYAFFLAGVLVHLILDALINETSVWF